MIRKVVISFGFVFLLSWSLAAQLQSYNFSQLDSLRKVEDKKAVVFIHTDWCKYCVKMEQTTFKNDKVIRQLNDDFHFIDLNGETKEDIQYQGQIFKFVPRGRNTGTHELARQLGTINGKLNYPTICVLNSKNEIVFQYDGYMRSNELKAVLNELNN